MQNMTGRTNWKTILGFGGGFLLALAVATAAIMYWNVQKGKTALPELLERTVATYKKADSSNTAGLAALNGILLTVHNPKSTLTTVLMGCGIALNALEDLKLSDEDLANLTTVRNFLGASNGHVSMKQAGVFLNEHKEVAAVFDGMKRRSMEQQSTMVGQVGPAQAPMPRPISAPDSSSAPKSISKQVSVSTPASAIPTSPAPTPAK
jgi:hypothetical protein